MLLDDPERDPAGSLRSRRLWPAVAVLGLIVGVAGLVVGLAADEPSTAPATAAGVVPDYGPERSLMQGFDHAGDAHEATAATPVEPYTRPDPTLPAVPAGEVKRFEAYRDVRPGRTLRFRFVAKHPGVFMYHCGTKPVLRHVGAGMAGMMVAKPRDLAKVGDSHSTDKEN